MPTLNTLVAALLFTLSAQAAPPIRIAVAASLSDVISKITAERRDVIGEAQLVLGASGQLVTQIRNGAEIDVFLSASPEFADDLVRDRFADAASRTVFGTNTLVLIAPAASTAPNSFEDLRQPAFRRVAIGDPATVPAGRYAAESLKSINLLDALSERLVYGKSVRHVLDYVERGEVAAGIVYSTDAKISGDKVRVVANAPHAPTEYVGVTLLRSREPQRAARVLQLLREDAAQKAFALEGFGPPSAASSQPTASNPASTSP